MEKQKKIINNFLILSIPNDKIQMTNQAQMTKYLNNLDFGFWI